ncbi:MAG: tetratricopeptide repeat protein, partial [Candidatus Omnitrophota bacterium]|nr:tetratricopeptide repeat protein [Candidatus Omnitrophota bacterium]
YLEMGKYEDAVKTLNRAIVLEPKNLETINSLGAAYGSLKKYDEAIKLFKKSTAIDPTFVSAYLNLGTTYEYTHEYEKAIAEYRKIAANTRGVQDIAISYVRLGDVHMKLKDPDKARAYYEKAVLTCGRGFEELKKAARERLAANWVEK